MKEVLLEIVKTVLFMCILYATTDYAYPIEITNQNKALLFGKIMYLTNISMYFSLITMSLSFLIKIDILPIAINAYMFMLPFSLSITALVTIMFWLLMFIDPTLVKNKDLYERGIYVSLEVELFEHLFPFLMLFLEQMTVLLQTSRNGVLGYIVFGIVYFTINLIAADYNKQWAYPILDNMIMINRVLFIALVSLIGIILYYGIVTFNRKIINKK